MEISQKDIEQVLDRFFRRSEAAKAAGGISHKDVVEGTPVPDGWQLDYELAYWLPPNVRLF